MTTLVKRHSDVIVDLDGIEVRLQQLLKGLCNNYQEGGGLKNQRGGGHYLKLLPR